MAFQPKPQTVEVESARPAEDAAANAGGVPPSVLPSDPEEYQALEKKLVRKVDWRLMPVLVVMIVLKYGYPLLPNKTSPFEEQGGN